MCVIHNEFEHLITKVQGGRHDRALSAQVKHRLPHQHSCLEYSSWVRRESPTRVGNASLRYALTS